MAIFTTDTDADGIATIAWDLPGRSMNVLTEDGIAELTGTVPDGPTAQRIGDDAARVDGVVGLDNKLEAQEPRGEED